MTAVLLEADELSAGYDGHGVVSDLNLEVGAGEIVALFGSNGAGKTTTLLTLAGELSPISGRVKFDGEPTTAPMHRRARAGMSFVTEERSVFMRLSAADNLKVAGCDPDAACELFPELRPLLGRTAGLMSGGEQQMLTLARALTRETRVLLADELSLGLAPMVVRRLLRALRQAADERGIGILLVEQHVREMLRIADRAYMLSRGKIILSGTAAEVTEQLGAIESSYLGLDATASPSKAP